jgi:16S rRNA (guanine527-N7)-methyltransferase
MTLLDAAMMRGKFLQSAVGELDLTARVEVVVERAEIAGRHPDLRGRFQVVIARSFGPPAVTAECATGFLEAGGLLLVSEPPDTAGADRWPADGLAQLGLVLGRRIAADGATIQVLHQASVCADKFPRANGRPAKRPLF